MTTFCKKILPLGCALVLAGCAGATVSQESTSAPVTNARPQQIVVYPFATNPSEVTLNQGPLQRVFRNVSGANADAEQSKIADETAEDVCQQVAAALNQKGYSALCQKRGVPAGTGNILVIDGQFTKIDEGNTARRLVIGFGAGAASLDTSVYVVQPAPDGGQRQILSFDTHADSGKMPGAAVTGPVGAAGGASAGVAAGASVAMGGAKTYSSSMGYLGGKTADQIVQSLVNYFAAQGWAS